MAPLPKLFLGSSSEGRAQAEACATYLREDVDVVPWWDAPAFVPLAGTLDALIASAQEYDFGLFVLTPDDSIESRDIRGHTARDNVWFELGLFLGELGRDRCFALIQQGPGEKRVKVPSDLSGITIPRLDAGGADLLDTSISRACRSLRPALRLKSFRQLEFHLVDGWSFDAKAMSFRMVLSERLIADNFHRLQSRSLLLVVRRKNDKIDRDSDNSIVVGSLRRIPRQPQRLELEEPCAALLQLDGDPRLDGYLYLMPAIDVTRAPKTIDDILMVGGRLIEARGRDISSHVRKE